MQIWFILALFSISFLACAELIQQKVLTDKNPLSEKISMGVTSLATGIISLIASILIGKFETIRNLFLPGNLPLFMLVCITSFFSIYFYLKSFKVQNISISIVFMSGSTFVTLPMGILLYGESWNLPKLFGILLTFLAIFSINYAKKSIEKNNYYAIPAGFLFGLNYVIDKKMVLISHPTTYLGLILIVVSLISLISTLSKFKVEIKKITLKVSCLLFISSILYFIYNVAIFFSYTYGGEVGKLDSINGSYIFIIIAVEYFIFKQRENTLRKVISSIIGITGVFLLGYYN